MSPSSRRAWIEIPFFAAAAGFEKSPSSRRAWIEICRLPKNVPHRLVALLAEGVDRNSSSSLMRRRIVESPSSRRAWIEIECARKPRHTEDVALLAEGVDRNIVAIDQFDFLECRPPHGEHTSNPLSIRLHAPSFLQASHRFGGRRLFPCKPASPTFPPLASSCAVQNKSKRRHDPLYGPRRLLLQGSFACSTQAQYPGSG